MSEASASQELKNEVKQTLSTDRATATWTLAPPDQKTHKYRPGEKVWLALADEKKVEAIVMETWWKTSVETQEPVYRIRFKPTDKKYTVADFTLAKNEGELKLTGPTANSIREVAQEIGRIPPRTLLEESHTEHPTIGDCHEHDVKDYVFGNVGEEMSHMVDGWLYICAPARVRVKVLEAIPVYRVRMMYSGLTPGEFEAGKGETIGGIEELRLTPMTD